MFGKQLLEKINMIRYRNLIFFVLLILISANVFGQNVDPKILSQAQAGDSNAQLLLGSIYMISADKNDIPLAVEWITKSAMQGNTKAQHMLALHYESNENEPYNLVKAIYWHDVAAYNNNSDSKYRLGHYYIEGKFDEDDKLLTEYKPSQLDITAGVMYLKEAASLGNPDSQYMLGNMYSTGRNIPKDLVLAMCWLGISAKTFQSMIVNQMDEIYYGGKYKKAYDELTSISKNASQKDTNETLKLFHSWSIGKNISRETQRAN